MGTVARARPSPVDHRFYAWSGIVAALVVFAGFARSYYLRAFFATHALPHLVQVHGALMTSWFVLLLTQVSLVSAHRTDLHRRLGILGAILASFLVIAGIATAFAAAARDVHNPERLDTLMFLGLGTIDLIVFGVLVGTAVTLRHRSDFHKRLMLLAAVSIVPAAIIRIPIHFMNSVPAALGLTDLFILVIVAIDTVRNHRLHPAFGWGAPFVILSLWAASFGASTQAWMDTARRLVT